MNMNEMIDKTLFRMNMLGGMNEYVINVIGDEKMTEIWLRDGVPDGADEDDLREIAEDDDLWSDMVAAFDYVITLARIGGDEY